MPQQDIPVVLAAVAYFATFALVLGGTSIWCALPPKRAKPKTRARTAQRAQDQTQRVTP